MLYLKQEYEKKLKQLKQEEGIVFRNIAELRTKIEETEFLEPEYEKELEQIDKGKFHRLKKIL